LSHRFRYFYTTLSITG